MRLLSIGFFPDRDDFNALLKRLNAGLELRLGLMRKAIADSNRILVNFKP